MKKETFKFPQKQFLASDGDVHFGWSDRSFDQAAWRESIETVAKKDRRWLRRHPKAEYRLRPITQIEMKMTGNPPGTDVRVVRGPYGSQIRLFLLPLVAPSDAEAR